MIDRLIVMFSAALMICAAIYLGHQGLRLARINRMLEAIVKSLGSKS